MTYTDAKTRDMRRHRLINLLMHYRFTLRFAPRITWRLMRYSILRCALLIEKTGFLAASLRD